MTVNGILWGLLAALVLAPTRVRDAVEAARREPDRGDVPGWVMVTVMSAALVAALLVPFREAIVSAVQGALANVTGLAGQ
jgi:hypothetical protein